MTAYLPAKRGNTWVSVFDANDVLRYADDIIKQCNLILAKYKNNMITISSPPNRKGTSEDVPFLLVHRFWNVVGKIGTKKTLLY